VHSHFLYLCLFAIAVGAVLGAMLRSDRWEAIRLGLWIALGLVGTALALAWVMYFLSS
jgi:hypothetical protein